MAHTQFEPLAMWERVAALLSTWRGAGLAGFLLAFAALVLAFVSQYAFGLRPCALCVWQRWPYVFAIVFGGAALFLGERQSKPVVAALFGLAALSFLIGVGLGVYHSGVEFGWWSGLASCSNGGAQPGESFSAFMERVKNNPPVSCGDRQTFLLWGSMANWNILVSGFAAWCFYRAASRRAAPEPQARRAEIGAA